MTRQRHKPDHELQLMLRVLRDLASLPLEGRKRAVAYWASRIEEMPPIGNQHGEQQLDIEDVRPPSLHVRGAAA